MKVINKENWVKIDPICEQMIALSLKDMSPEPMFPEYWLDRILAPRLDDRVGVGIKSLFETARGAMVYGYFYFPLFSIGVEQLLKAYEAAITEKYQQSNGPNSKRKSGFISLADKLKWLKKQAVIDEDQYCRFENLRLYRNLSFHADAQRVIPPSNASASLGLAAKWINQLFATHQDELN